jgi:tripartite-type tricarboxylate transporter receptor subunit TctC
MTIRPTGLAARTAAWVAAACAAGLAPAPSSAADFYAGKTIEFIIGSNPGGGYDIYARALARHIVRHIPGHPTIVPKNLPGAGSAKAAAFIHSMAAKDGTALGAVFPGAIMEPLLGDRSQAQYDPTKLQYVGTADNGTRICITGHNSQTRTFEDALKRKTIVGASQAGGSSRDYAYLHNKLNKTQFDIVSGYKGTVDILLAIERGEVDGTCGYDWSSLNTQKPDWLRDKKVNILVQVALEPEATLTRMGVPRIWQYIKGEEDKKVAELVVTQQVFGRPYFLPPGTPAAQVKILRDAFVKTMADPAFLDEAKRLRLSIDPLDGEKVQKIVETLYAAPAGIVERAKAAVKP